MNWEILASILASLATAGATIALAWYARRQVKIENARSTRENKPHIVVAGKGLDPMAWRLSVANLSPHAFWVQRCYVRDYDVQLIFVGSGSRTSNQDWSMLLPPGEAGVLILGDPEDPPTGTARYSAEELPDWPELVIEGFYGPTGQDLRRVVRQFTQEDDGTLSWVAIEDS